MNKYDSIILKWAKNYQIPWELVKAVIFCESSFNEQAISSCGAKGLMQLMPSVYEPEGIDPLDPDSNVRVGCAYLKRMWNIFKAEEGLERWKYALGSYNMGLGYVLSSQKMAEEKGAKTDKWCHISVFLDRAKHRGGTADWKQGAEYVDKVILKMIDYVIEHITSCKPCRSLEEYLSNG